MIELRRLHRFFGKTKAVNDITFEVERGQVFGYIGPNGAGKTTSMRILATLELPTYGDAFVDGLSVVNDPDLVRRRMGFMPDGFGTYPNIDCVEYLDFFARAYGMVGKDRQSAIRRTLSFTGLDKIASKPIRGLSKGMRQRLCLGRAMIHNPAVMILDEPANGLDPRARIELRRLIRTLADEGKAILVSSHILTELAEMCDQVGIIERGRLLAVGSVEAIKKQMQSQATEDIGIGAEDGTPQTAQPLVKVCVEAMSEQASIRSWLEARSDVSNVQVAGEKVVFDFQGNKEKRSQLLAEMVQSGLKPIEFAPQQQSLEDIFMQITTGAVQ